MFLSLPEYFTPLLFTLTFVFSATLALPAKTILRRLKIVDVPNERSSHTTPVLRGLGLAVVTAYLLGTVFAVYYLSFYGVLSQLALALVSVAVLVAGALGLREDFAGLSVKTRTVLAFVAAALLAAGALALHAARATYTTGGTVAASAVSPYPLWLYAILAVYGTLFISSYINVANFMDGLNGISGAHAVIAGTTFAILGWMYGAYWLQLAGVLIAAAYAGFLPWNLSARGAFLGDIGSYALGAGIATTSFVALTFGGVPVLATIGPLVIYFGDVAYTLIRRVCRGAKWHEAHREHAYQRIAQILGSHRAGTLTASIATIMCSILGILAGTGENAVRAVLCFAVAALVLGGYLALPAILSSRCRGRAGGTSA